MTNWSASRALLTLVALAFGATVAVGDADGTSNGKQVFDRWCADCHAPVSPRRQLLAGTYALEQIYKGSKPAALEQRTDLMQPYIKMIVRSGRNVMPPSRKTEISDEQLDALAAYLSRAR